MIYSAEEVSACLRLNTLGEDKMQPHNLTGQVLEHYRIKRPVGYGGMATVFLAEDLNLRRDIAVKVFEPAGNIARISSGALSGRHRFSRNSITRTSCRFMTLVNKAALLISSRRIFLVALYVIYSVSVARSP